MDKIDKLKGLCALNERVQSLLNDGYHILFHYKSDDLQMVKLRHHNGNRIVLKLTFSDGILSQRTNHIPTFHAKVC